MEVTIKQVQEIVSVLTPDEQQLLKDAINYGAWGNCDMEFLDESSKIVTVGCYGYCTNDANKAGHFKGRVVSSMFKSIYKKMCPENHNQIGRYLCHINDWWDDGSGDMLFIREGFYHIFEEWAKSRKSNAASNLLRGNHKAMTENQAMLIVAEQVAREQGYIEVSKNTLNALQDRFWGNVAVAVMAGKPVVITTCKYILPMFEEDKDDRKRRPKVEIDMFWGKPRLGIDLPDGTFCCLTYKDGICSEAQAFGDKGLAFAISIKERIDYLLHQ